MRKIALLFVGAAASFMLLSYVDEYENLLLPFFSAERRTANISTDEIKEDLLITINDFNKMLYSAYFLSDISVLSSEQIGDGVRSAIAEDISYLTKEGKVMDLKIKSIEIKRVTALSARHIQVTTRGKAELRYLDRSGKEEGMYQETEYPMAYTLEQVKGGWKVISFETTSVSEAGQ